MTSKMTKSSKQLVFDPPRTVYSRQEILLKELLENTPLIPHDRLHPPRINIEGFKRFCSMAGNLKFEDYFMDQE